VSDFVTAVTRRTARRKVTLEVLWDAFADASPVDASAPDARRRLAGALRDGEHDGAWVCAKKTDLAGRPPLPAFVTLPAAATAVRADPSTAAWRPELAWAAGLRRLSGPHLAMLLAVNAFLRDGGANRPLVPSEERSLELFDDEKVISGRVGGASLWAPSRLSTDLLRCVPSSTPFAYERVGSGARLLVVENQATFATVRDLLRAELDHDYAAVAFGAGRAAASTIGYLTELPFAVHGVDYFGDLDVDGLEMAAACVAAARTTGVMAGPHDPLWRLLLEQTPTPAEKVPSPARAAKAAEVLCGALRPRALELLTSGRRIAQERCGRDLLATLPGWWRR
jgi:hypothetical protein